MWQLDLLVGDVAHFHALDLAAEACPHASRRERSASSSEDRTCLDDQRHLIWRLSLLATQEFKYNRAVSPRSQGCNCMVLTAVIGIDLPPEIDSCS